MTLPAIGLLALFHYVPTFGNIIAFQDYSTVDGILHSPFVGFGNFAYLLSEPAFWRAARNTVAITSFQLVFYFPIPIAMAILLNSVLGKRTRAIIQNVAYLPHFFSWVLVITIFQDMLGGAGLLGQFFTQHGVDGVDLTTNPDTFIALVTAQTIWKDAGWGTIIFLAALSTINPNLYEASAVDGASRWRRLWHITLPGLRPVIILLLILRLGDALNVGFEQFLLQRGAVGANAAEVIDTYVYWLGLRTGDYSIGAAASLLKGVIGLVLILVANRVAHKLGEQGIYQRT
ncbi:sugar ABC transporter permease [Streptosporangiaceae bacterium NEAU-GS5]|nr:sugar ABC transporter permease [Streptosporangiaceae bacterium NEAU-GS5]